MKFKEIINRLNGISTPIFGMQWMPTELQVTKARRVISFLEDRRVLFNPYEWETSDYCLRSVIEIRQFLTSVIGDIDEKDEFAESLRAMRAACRKFIDSFENNHRRTIILYRDDFDSRGFFSGLGELRGVFGIHIAKIAAQYGLDVEDGLASILPETDENEV